MAEIRRIASLVLEARQKAGIKVRQPIASLKIKNQKSKIKNNKSLLEILADEINVKQIVFDGKINPPDGGEVELDTKITPELKAEGRLRELVRIIQDLRKEAGYQPKDKIYLWLEAPKEIESAINKYLDDFKEKIGAKNIEFRRADKFDAGIETKIDSFNVWLGIKKI
jgi:isoleucyl-tRNA synthetase